MLPPDLKPATFSGYPPEARRLTGAYLSVFQVLPLSFLASLLREVSEYDFKFPVERRALENELRAVASLSAQQRQEWFKDFDQIQLSPELENSDWAVSPAQFIERLSAYLWSSHQLDKFRQAATDYASRLSTVTPPEPPPAPRLGIAVIGQGVETYEEPIFRKLRPHGAYFTNVNPANGLAQLLSAASARAKAQPVAYGHWYVDGGAAADHDPALTLISYGAMEPLRNAILRKMQAEINKPGMGPETLRTLLAQMRAEDLGLERAADPLLERFQIKLLTEGSGTQVFSTAFAQWTAREALRRAQPLTLVVRFAPRQRQRPMNELLSASSAPAQLDPVGSLIDGDMGAYYNWINQQRLPGAEQSSFLVWFEGHKQALAIGPTLPRGTESSAPTDLQQLLCLAS